MKKFLLLSLVFLFGTILTAEAQYRENLNQSSSYTGAIIRSQPTSSGSWMDMMNMSMSHSYNMTFSSVGGQFQNLNAYTNHMAFQFNDRLTGNLDVAFLHSPFGNSFMTANANNSLGTRILIDRAQLNYELSPNAHLSVQFSQRPYQYSPYGGYQGYMYGNNYPGFY